MSEKVGFSGLHKCSASVTTSHCDKYKILVHVVSSPILEYFALTGSFVGFHVFKPFVFNLVPHRKNVFFDMSVSFVSQKKIVTHSDSRSTLNQQDA